ncbi:MAG: hypothetical protein ABIF85_01620 [Nanoarchaeota archaeon]|nr:hypothetical protein [Nanoarchaeota archaeon]MBU4300250.1 hypothetical protein [Nanoarchaeota archaeon]MBU4452536.1 hypothetical protein [Nanoarchaeota archaeon]MCG2723241.1 hypothetical protein [archaeon]
MFKGFILSESLNTPTLLNEFRKIYVKVEDRPESKNARFWHLFKIETDDKNIEEVAKKISKELKYGRYAHFWNGKFVYVSFVNKVFKIPQEKKWSSKEFQEVKEYGAKNGVGEEYLDFWIEDWR